VLQAIHETCVIHRDLKPANIFMCPDNVVKVGDLGVAKVRGDRHGTHTASGRHSKSHPFDPYCQTYLLKHSKFRICAAAAAAAGSSTRVCLLLVG
jgi:serine/threonine protein kinase